MNALNFNWLRTAGGGFGSPGAGTSGGAPIPTATGQPGAQQQLIDPGATGVPAATGAPIVPTPGRTPFDWLLRGGNPPGAALDPNLQPLPATHPRPIIPGGGRPGPVGGPAGLPAGLPGEGSTAFSWANLPPALLQILAAHGIGGPNQLPAYPAGG